MKKRPRIVNGGRGQDGYFAKVQLETGEELLPQEAIRQLKLGNISGNYGQGESLEDSSNQTPNLENNARDNNGYQQRLEELTQEYDEEK